MRYIFVLGICMGSLCASILEDSKTIMGEYFPHEKIKYKSIFPTLSQQKDLKSKAKQKLTSKAYYYFITICDDKPTGYGFLLNSKVRSKNIISLYLVSIKGDIKAIEILRFDEPVSYLPRKTWLAQFHNKNIKNKLKIKQDITNITGATFSARAVTKQSRLALGLFDLIVKY